MMEVEHGSMKVRKHGAPKFVERVLEVTFNGQRALRAGKKVFYATPVGLFRLTQRGIELESVFPGVDVRRDVLDLSPARIVLPPSGDVPVFPGSIVTGDAFDLPDLRRFTAAAGEASVL
jgi:propionate CoA-transferase